MATPTVAHWEAVLGVVRYLVRTANYDLTFGGSSETLVGYCGADYTRDLDHNKVCLLNVWGSGELVKPIATNGGRVNSRSRVFKRGAGSERSVVVLKAGGGSGAQPGTCSNLLRQPRSNSAAEASYCFSKVEAH